MNRIDETKLIRVVSDNPGITCKGLAEKLGIKQGTIKYRLIALEKDKRIFRQTKGCTKLLFTVHAAEVNHVPDEYDCRPGLTILEQQMWFNQLSRVAR